MTQVLIETVTTHISPLIQSPFELVAVEWDKLGQDHVLRILVDKPEGISLEDTADLSELISPALDKIQPDPFPKAYMLEVASPGAERPLTKPSDYQTYLNHHVFISLYQKIAGDKQFTGDLIAFDGEAITLRYRDKTRDKEVTIPLSAIAKARLAVKL